MQTVQQIAIKWGLQPQRIRQLLAEGRISGAQKVGRDWVIPDDAKRPERKNGRKP